MGDHSAGITPATAAKIRKTGPMGNLFSCDMGRK